MSARSRTVAVVVLACAFALPWDAGAQARLTGADLSGTIVDQSGGAMPGVTVTVTNLATNLTRTTASDDRGRYTVAALPPGTYRLTADITGFVTETRDQVVLLLGQSVTMDFQLKVAGAAESITVSAESPVVAVTHTEVSSVVNQQQIENLPINGRNFISFAVITPGVTTDRTPQQGASATSGLSFTGQRARSNNIMVDGLDNNDQVVGAVRSTFSQEAVREFQVLTNSYSAEFGKATGGVVNIVTKSGTNQFSGNVFGYFRDESLNATSYFEKFDLFGNSAPLDKAPFKQTQWGATLGGPIKRDQTFFFASFERAETDASNLVTIPAAAATLLNTLGFPVEVGHVPYSSTLTQFMVKVDHQWAPNHGLVVRGNWADVENENIEPFGGSIARSRGAEQLRTDWSVSASETDIIANRWINELRVQFAPQDQEINSLDPRCGGPCLDENLGGPTLEITGVASVGRQRFTPQPRKNRRLQFLDTISYVSGGHNVKAGIEFNHIKATRGALPLHFGGRYIFSAVPALGIPSALAALQLGLPAAYVQGYGNSTFVYPAKDLSLFLQDEWRWRRLVLKPGVRYQRQCCVRSCRVRHRRSRGHAAALRVSRGPQRHRAASRRRLRCNRRRADVDPWLVRHVSREHDWRHRRRDADPDRRADRRADAGRHAWSIVRGRALQRPGVELAGPPHSGADGCGHARRLLSDPCVCGRPRAGDAVRASGRGRRRSRTDGRPRAQRQCRLRPGLRTGGDHRLQPGAAGSSRRWPSSQRSAVLGQSICSVCRWRDSGDVGLRAPVPRRSAKPNTRD